MTNRYLQSVLKDLTATHETEIDYLPIEVPLSAEHVNKKEDIQTLMEFVSRERKRLFIFKLADEELAKSNPDLFFKAQRSFLNHTAAIMLQRASSQPAINPLKVVLNNPSATVRAAIQIQKNFPVPKPPQVLKSKGKEKIEQLSVSDIKVATLDAKAFPALTQQLEALKIEIQDAAAEKIKKHAHAFTDGIIPDNLPRGFYILSDPRTLCYTKSPHRLPSALAPKLEEPSPIDMPSFEQVQLLLPTILGTTIEALLNNDDLHKQTAALAALPSHAKEIKGLLNSIKPAEAEFIVPLLAKLFILGGESHTKLFIQLLQNCVTKNLSLEFLKDDGAQNAFLSPRGLKNLQKLLQLPAEQREWWNTLAITHLQNEQHQFDFNSFFEAYTQIFLPQIADKNLTLPQPCPIHHKGHFLITLNRVMDVLEKAKNPQEQCLNLANLNWGVTGVHYAMTQAAKPFRVQQAAACMKWETAKDTDFTLENIRQQIDVEGCDLNLWLFRFIGQHWKREIRLSDISSQLNEIQTIPGWSEPQKKQLSFILAASFEDESPVTAGSWKKSTKNCIELLKPLADEERSHLLDAVSQCYKFKPCPALIQIQQLIEQCLELKTAFPNRDFKNEILNPIISCLENEGFELVNTLQARVQKLEENRTQQLKVILSFVNTLQSHRNGLLPNTIKLLAALNEPDLNGDQIEALNLAIQGLQATKGDPFSTVLLGLLAKINIAKSQTLPKIKEVQDLIIALAKSNQSIPVEERTLEKQEKWVNDLISVTKPLGCVLGNGDISRLDDLIIDAMCEAVKKRSGILKIKELKAVLDEQLGAKVVPVKLKNQLHAELYPLLDAIDGLVVHLQGPNPKFTEVQRIFKLFEEKKEVLLKSKYSLVVGSSTGEYLLSYLLTGKRKEGDNVTGGLFASILPTVHKILVDKIKNFFDDPRNKDVVKDLDVATVRNWFEQINKTHTVTFLFKEELIQKKVIPALKKTLVQLDTRDADFENSILAAAADLSEDQPSDIALENYKIKIESISNYLNLLIDLKAQFSTEFPAIYKQLNTGALARLSYAQKQALVGKLPSNPAGLAHYLKFSSAVLDENPEADEQAIDRAIGHLDTLFPLKLDFETEVMFFKMSMNHNLKNESPFPLATLNELKQAQINGETKDLIIKQIIQILSHMPASESPDSIQNLIQNTQNFLKDNPTQTSVCINLLKRISSHEFAKDVNAYSKILQSLSNLSKENRSSLLIILDGLAKNQKDDTVSLSLLLDITTGLEVRKDIDEVTAEILKLFATPPYPIAQRLNAALGARDIDELKNYCRSFDTNPFAKAGEKRDLAAQFSTDRVKEALLDLEDLLQGVKLPHSLQLKLARQLTYIETLGYTDPLNPYDFQSLKKLTKTSRKDLKDRAMLLMDEMRNNKISQDELENVQMELLALLREIYFRSTGLFPNSTQMLVLLLALQSPDSNLLMRIKTGEGKSLITPMFAVLQWAKGGTVDVCTANGTLLSRDYENSCEPFFNFLGIKSALIKKDSRPEDYQLNGINCSTIEDMSLFRLTAKETHKEYLIQIDGQPIHLVIDESDDALLDQTTLYKLVAEIPDEDNSAQWVYHLAYQFINQPTFRHTDAATGKVWDEEEDLEQFRLFINKEIMDNFNGDADKQNFIMAASNTQLKEWINASCKAAKLIENKDYIVRPLKEKDESGNEITKKIVCVPLVKSTPKTGSIFTDSVQQALQARLMAERKDQARYFFIDAYPSVLSSQSARGLIQFYKDRNGRIIGISGTPGDRIELQYLATFLGTQAIGIGAHAGDKRTMHEPIFTFSKEESIQAIHRAIDNIKVRTTEPSVKFSRDTHFNTIQEKEAFALSGEKAKQEWNNKQTQPVLIVCENFNEAQTIGQTFAGYEKGFRIQVVTGKESSEELDHIIKQAGEANTITIGTAMLARGIDINPGDHPEGLFVIQTYPDSERMTTQIAGRAARNGKPGQWLPIYQIEPPQHWFEKTMYSVFPWYRQRKGQAAVATLQEEIRLQANVDRLYTQALDQAQQTLMLQVHIWEGLLLELYPADEQIKYELYQWRQALLSQLSQIQETNLSENTLKSCIDQFQNTLCKIWETAKEEKWLAKAKNASHISAEQTIRINYLKQLDLSQELNVQRELEKKSQPFTEGTNELMHYNLDTLIQDKAGAVLEYAPPTEAEKRRELELAQSKQLLPSLIGELCSYSPEAMKKFSSQHQLQLPPVLENLLSRLINWIFSQKNNFLTENKKKMAQEITKYYQNKLNPAESKKESNQEEGENQNKLNQDDSKEIRDLLNEIKPFIIDQGAAKISLVDKFKMQGLILTFCKLYNQSGLDQSNITEEDRDLTALKARFNEEIMKTLAVHLMQKFEWVNASPQPIHALFERKASKDAAKAIYELALKVAQSPNEENIHVLYTGLKERQLILQDKHLFSIRHSNPRNVINKALAAIEALNVAPHCDRQFRDECHDKVLFSHHLEQFHTCLNEISSSLSKDPVWAHLKGNLTIIAQNQQSHVITELYQAVERFYTYPAYFAYRNQLRKMKELLANSVKELEKPGGIKKDSLDGLLMHKQSRFAELLNIDAQNIRIQSGCDSRQHYIEIQIQNAPLQKEFTGYSSTYIATLEEERNRITEKGKLLTSKEDSIRKLSNKEDLDLLPAKKAEFEKLFNLKRVLGREEEGFDLLKILLKEVEVPEPLAEIPEEIGMLLVNIKQLKELGWSTSVVEKEQRDKIFGVGDDVGISADTFEKHTKLCREFEDISERKRKASKQLQEKKDEISPQKDSSNVLKNLVSKVKGMASNLSDLEKNLNQILQEEQTLLKELNELNSLLDVKTKAVITNREMQAKLSLGEHIQKTSNQLFDNLMLELEQQLTSIDKITHLEGQKSRFQTLRVRDIPELLRYEARLNEEEHKIPAMQKRDNTLSRMLHTARTSLHFKASPIKDACPSSSEQTEGLLISTGN